MSTLITDCRLQVPYKSSQVPGTLPTELCLTVLYFSDAVPPLITVPCPALPLPLPLPYDRRTEKVPCLDGAASTDDLEGWDPPGLRLKARQCELYEDTISQLIGTVLCRYLGRDTIHPTTYGAISNSQHEMVLWTETSQDQYTYTTYFTLYTLHYTLVLTLSASNHDEKAPANVSTTYLRST
ncbi:hypothetical protein CIB48_g3734 [Xylaria polymorpha]|nr:hypothetical protein CIB48_g3734 [Xylaria polymorpha]